MKNSTSTCYKEAINLLKKNSTKYGILACSPSVRAKNRNYLSVFGRDASICVLGMISSRDKELIKTAKASLKTLADNQANNGQIPNFVKPEEKRVDYWRMGTTDSTLWWLLALNALKKSGENKFVEKFKKNISKAISFLEAWEHPTFNLLVQLEASDWADLMPRSGYVLYNNALWCYVKKIYNLKNYEKSKKYFSYLFDPQTKMTKKIEKENIRFFNFVKTSKRNEKNNALVSYVKRYESGNEVDIFANCLSFLTETTNKKRAKEILTFFLENNANKPISVKTVLNPIKPKSKQWQEYMNDHHQNHPYKYHNGGVWPFITAFWIISLSEAGFKKEAEDELEELSKLNLKSGFNEWFHGKTKRAMGKKGQSWNAAMYIYAYNKINTLH